MNQWNNILPGFWKNTTETVQFWCKVYNYKDASGENPFHELSRFAMSVLVLPISNAEVERIFSQLNLVKTNVRNMVDCN